MSEAFKVAVDRQAMRDAYWKALQSGADLDGHVQAILGVLDLPAVVRSEVARALQFAGLPEGEHHELADSEVAYLNERFGFPEAAPGESVGNAGLDSPPRTRAVSSNAADEAASGRARGEDANSPTPRGAPEPVKCACMFWNDEPSPRHFHTCPLYVPTPSVPVERGHCGMSNDGEDASRCVLGFGHSGACRRPVGDGTTCAKCGEAVGHLPSCEYFGRVAGSVPEGKPIEFGAPPEHLFEGSERVAEPPGETGRRMASVKLGIPQCLAISGTANSYVNCQLERDHIGNHRAWSDDESLQWRVSPSCTACACPACRNKDAFLRALAEEESRRVHCLCGSDECAANKSIVAARKVVG